MAGARIVRPFSVPRAVRPYEHGPFRLDSRDGFLFDHFAKEHTDKLGTELLLWSQDFTHATTDPVYGEPISRSWQGPFRFRGYVEYPANEAENAEQGTRQIWTATAWIARKVLEEAGAPPPNESDILFVTWSEKANFFGATWANDSDPIPAPERQGYYFDVTQVNEDGHVFDSSHFVGFRYDLKRNTTFTPERKLP